MADQCLKKTILSQSQFGPLLCRGGGGDYCSANQWLTGTTNSCLLTVIHLGEGLGRRTHCSADQWLSKSAIGCACPAPVTHCQCPFHSLVVKGARIFLTTSC